MPAQATTYRGVHGFQVSTQNVPPLSRSAHARLRFRWTPFHVSVRNDLYDDLYRGHSWRWLWRMRCLLCLVLCRDTGPTMIVVHVQHALTQNMFRFLLLLLMIAYASAGPVTYVACVAASTALCVPGMWWLGPPLATVACSNIAIAECFPGAVLPTP